MDSMDDLDDIGPDDTMELDGGKMVDLSHVRMVYELDVRIDFEDLDVLERLASERGVAKADVAGELLTEALRVRR
jgi:hypothetical protein